VNPENRDCVRDVILLEVESINKGRYLKDPWGLIYIVNVNQPLGAEMIYLVAILQASKLASIAVRKLISMSYNWTLIYRLNFQMFPQLCIR